MLVILAPAEDRRENGHDKPEPAERIWMRILEQSEKEDHIFFPELADPAVRRNIKRYNPYKFFKSPLKGFNSLD
jgi:hypothetical protein